MNTDYSIIKEGKKVYFASDFHLGAPKGSVSLERERKIVRWLDTVKEDAEAIFLVGDIFDFWFEYQQAIPKGFARFQGKIAELTDVGISVVFFSGNHDLWMSNYFPTELGVTLFTKAEQFLIHNKTFYIGHGDGLGKGDNKYKFLKKVFINPISKWLFRWLHPDVGMWVASKWSNHSREQCEIKDDPFLGEEEALIEYSNSLESTEHHDFYIFGHRHLPIEFELNDASKYINLGQWFDQCNYGVFDGESFELKGFEATQEVIKTPSHESVSK